MQEPRRGTRPFRFCPRVERLRGLDDLHWGEALSRLRELGRPVLLESAVGEPRRFSLLAFDPLPPTTSLGAEPSEPTAPGCSPFAELRARLANLERVDGGDPLPPFFSGGFLGALSYDLGSQDEALGLPPDPLGWPPVVGGLYVDWLLRDHGTSRTWLVLGDEPGDGRASVAERRRRILDGLERPHPGAAAPRALGPLERHVSPEEHARRIEEVRRWIARGEIYQANLSHRFERRLSAHPVDLYLALRASNPAPYLGYVGVDGAGGAGHGQGVTRAILSASPELLLDFEPARDGQPARALTRPIKGTAPRLADAEQDRVQRAALLVSPKDRAELAMIVDLERNDLGRMAEVDGVSVGEFPRLESFATVHHLMCDVRARTRPGVDGLAVLEALYPGGSITGAPKLRSMEVIAELEQEGRGYAYGSLLMADLEGRVLANLLIRTLLWQADAPGAREGLATYRVGGGITWRSQAQEEEREALHKGVALARALAVEDA